MPRARKQPVKRQRKRHYTPWVNTIEPFTSQIHERSREISSISNLIADEQRRIDDLKAQIARLKKASTAAKRQRNRR